MYVFISNNYMDDEIDVLVKLVTITRMVKFTLYVISYNATNTIQYIQYNIFYSALNI